MVFFALVEVFIMGTYVDRVPCVPRMRSQEAQLLGTSGLFPVIRLRRTFCCYLFFRILVVSGMFV